MKKLATYLIILTWTIVITTIKVFANPPYELEWRQIPVVCGVPEEVNRYIDDKNLKPKHFSLGREGSKPDGEPVYVVTLYSNDTGEVLVTVDTPSGIERCILFHTFNLTEAPEAKGI